MIEIPKQVLIGTQVFDIELRSRTEDGMLNDTTMGYTLGSENLIVIDKILKPTKQRVTLMHEILHAFFAVYDSSVKPSKKDDFEVWEHYFIGIYEEALVLLFKDNPELVKYLITN